MKKITLYSLVLILGLLVAPLVATSTKVNHLNHKIYIRTERNFTLDALTVYHPTVRQCDRSPLITASNKKIDLKKLQQQDIRWMALSRDLLKRWKGEFRYGDTVLVTSGDATIDGLWIIHDTMNKRYKNRGDLLFASSVRKLGKWNNVQISHVQWLNL